MLTRRNLLAAALAAPAGLALGGHRVFAAEARGAWAPCAPVPWKVQEVYGTVRDGRIVIAGGLNAVKGKLNALDRMGLYDPATDTWTEGPRMPEPRHHPVLATVGPRVYAIGGAVGSEKGDWLQRADVFVEEGGRWSRAAPLPEPQMEGVALVHEGRIHLVSGRKPKGENAVHWHEQEDVDTHRVFDPASGKWSLARPIPGARNSAAGGVIDGALYVVGGRTMAEGNMARLDRYDPKTDRWEALRPLPRAAGGLAAAVLGGGLIVFGGEEGNEEGPEGVIGHTWRYDVARDSWEPLAAMRTPRHGLAGVTVGGRVFAVGGGSHVSGGKTTAIVEALSL